MIKNIVKVQIAIDSNVSDYIGKRVLLYNQDKSLYVEKQAGQETLNRMGDKQKKYFTYTTVKDGGIEGIQLLDEVEWQNW